MSVTGNGFDPLPSIVPGIADEHCRACVTIPARNEAASLPRCLDALAGQMDLCGSSLPPASFEVLVLLNNCTDVSAQVARAWHRNNPLMELHIVERILPSERAHVGTARRLLMDTAWTRLSRRSDRAIAAAILCTDADTVTAPDWIAQNLQAVQHGADVVGGIVDVVREDLGALPARIRRCYERDRCYAGLVAELEHLLDPQEGDPWPRHLDHFGSSLACTPHAYALAGGMPPVSPLEDEAFIDRVRHASLRLRHEPEVRVYTSARLEGRAGVGFAGQFRLWSNLPCDEAHRVKSAAFLEHRFRFMRRLREIFANKSTGNLRLPTEWWVNTFSKALAKETTCAGFLGAVYCNILIQESFGEQSEEPIDDALDGLRRRIAAARTAQSRWEDRALVRAKEVPPNHSPDGVTNSAQ